MQAPTGQKSNKQGTAFMQSSLFKLRIPQRFGEKSAERGRLYLGRPGCIKQLGRHGKINMINNMDRTILYSIHAVFEPSAVVVGADEAVQ